jgi:hypothetical protein
MMIGDGRIDDVLSPRGNGRECSRIVDLHQSTEADDIGCQNGGKSASVGLFDHVVAFAIAEERPNSIDAVEQCPSCRPRRQGKWQNRFTIA